MWIFGGGCYFFVINGIYSLRNDKNHVVQPEEDDNVNIFVFFFLPFRTLILFCLTDAFTLFFQLHFNDYFYPSPMSMCLF